MYSICTFKIITGAFFDSNESQWASHSLKKKYVFTVIFHYIKHCLTMHTPKSHLHSLSPKDSIIIQCPLTEQTRQCFIEYLWDEPNLEPTTINCLFAVSVNYEGVFDFHVPQQCQRAQKHHGSGVLSKHNASSPLI